MTSVVRVRSGGEKCKSDDECAKNKVTVSCLDKKIMKLQEELENITNDFQININSIESKINVLNARINKEQYRRKSKYLDNKNTENIEKDNCYKKNQLPKHYLHILFHTMLVIYLFTKKKLK